MREKLIALCDTNNGWVDEVPAEKFADYLIAHGVAIPVRCKDCWYGEQATVNEKGFLICPASGMEITENDFCSRGERRSDD